MAGAPENHRFIANGNGREEPTPRLAGRPRCEPLTSISETSEADTFPVGAVRSALKGLYESVLLRGGPAALSRRRLGNRGLVLAYHNVVEDGDQGHGDASLHLPLHSFRAQLAALDERAEVVALSALLDSTEDREHAPSRERPRVAITFDDAYRGAVTLGLPELSRRGMPATVFVSPGRLGDQTFWWDRCAPEAARRGDSGFRDTALDELAGVDDDVAKWATANGWAEDVLPEAYRTVSEAELAEAARLPGVTFASHSWSHPNLTKLGDEELRTELARPREWLAARFQPSIPYLAYPYGIVDDRVAAAAADAGYEAGFRVEGGWLAQGRPPDRFLLPRLNVPAGLSDTGFRCRLAGLLSRG